jgi:hypothetical protein
MIASYIEARIRKFCGRYIKNFNSDNLSLSVGGLLNLSNLELDVNELNRFPLLFKPIFAFIGSVEIDFPIVLGGKLDISISNILLVLKREELQDFDPSTVHNALQVWISSLYLYLAQSESNTKSNLSASKVDYTQKWLEITSISISNVHVQIEENFTSHILSQGENERMCLGLTLSKIEFRSPNSKELETDPFYSQVYIYIYIYILMCILFILIFFASNFYIFIHTFITAIKQS